MPDVRMPDGTVIRNVPEGTTRAQLMARVGKAGAPQPQPKPTYREAIGSTGIDQLNEALIGIPQGLYNVASTVTDPIARLLVGDKPVEQARQQRGQADEAITNAIVRTRSPVARMAGQTVGTLPLSGLRAPQALGRAAPLLTNLGQGAISGAAVKDAESSGIPEAITGAVTNAAVSPIISGIVNRGAKAKIAAAVPTIDELKQQASNLYRAAENRGVTASQRQTKTLAAQFRQIASQEGLRSPTGRISPAYPKAKEALALVSDYSKGQMTPTQMQTVRKVLSDAAGSADNAERRMAKMMLNEFDDWTAPLAPELAEARAIARRYINAGKLETARELAGARAGQFSGSGFENALRTDYRALDRRIVKGQERGFTPETVEAIKKVARGTPASNIARGLGKMAPTGVVSGGISTGVPFAIGSTLGGPGAGVGLAALTNALGIGGRAAATRMGINNATLAELIARQGGALPVPQSVAPRLAPFLAPVPAYLVSRSGKKKKKQKQD